MDENREPLGVELDIDEQFEMLTRIRKHQAELPFNADPQEGLRYYYKNGYFSYTDGIILACLLLDLRPKKIIEIGSGFSSALMIDINERFLDNQVDITFIEPYPERLHSLLDQADKDTYTIHATEVQNVDITVYDSLEEGDLLFIDSSHILKTGSDLWHQIFNILPRLKKGVIIHFHDIFYPFEYSRDWVYGGKAYNETYFVRAFLMYNEAFKVQLFPHYLLSKNGDWFKKNMPDCNIDTCGSLYLKKVL